VRMKNADNKIAFTIQPCHTFGAPQVEYLVNPAFPSGNYLTLWSITNPTCVFRGKPSTDSNRKHPLIPIEVIQ